MNGFFRVFYVNMVKLNKISSYNKLAPYGTGSRLLLAVNFKVT